MVNYLTCELGSIKLPHNFCSYPPVNTSPKCRSYLKVAKNIPVGQNRASVRQVQISFILTRLIMSILSTAHRYCNGIICLILNFLFFLERESSISVSLICIVVGIAFRNTQVLPVPEQRRIRPFFHSGTVQAKVDGIQASLC